MFKEALKNELNVSITENGAVGYSTTGKNLLDFNFKVASYRNMDEDKIKVDFMKAWYEDKELALKYLFYVRDIREGVGERRLFRVCISQIINELDSRVFDWIEEYGRLDDIFVFTDTILHNNMIEWIADKLVKDIAASVRKQPCSLLAKWMPSINTSSKATRDLAKRFIKDLNFDPKTYRKTLSTLRSYIDVLEKKCCANEWDQIEYSKVSSQANLKYKDAFMKHDKDRRTQYLESLQKGETKINAATSFPHDIINKYKEIHDWRTKVKSLDITLEEMWKALPNYVEGNSNILVVRDGSGSMESAVGNTTTTALDVATALSIYFSERCEGQFKDNFITFSSAPQLVSFEKYTTLKDKIDLAYSYDDCSNTDIERTFDLVLKVAVKNNLKQEEIPNLLIISDMEFDMAHGNYDRTSENDAKLFKKIEAKFNEAGYKLPKLIFWNVNSRTNTIPLTQNENGVILVSGFSPAIVKMVLSQETDPYKALVKELMKERYSKVTLSKVSQ